MAQEPKYGGKLYHIGLEKKDVGRIALLPGDPGRVPAIAKLLRSPKKLASHREFVSFGGFVGKERVVVLSTGIGGPSTAIAVEELARLGVEVMVRVGTCGALQRRAAVGTLILPDAAVRLDGTTDQYVMKGYPAAADPAVVMALMETAARLGKTSLVGLCASTDSFYVGQGRKGHGGYFPSFAQGIVSDLQKARVLCFEMESSTLFTLGRLFGLRTGAVLSVVGNRVTDEFRVGAGIPDAISVAVNGISSFGRHDI